MADRFRSLPHGTGPASWIFYFVVIGAALYLVLPAGTEGLVGVLSGILSAIRVEMNDYRQRIERMEGERAASPADHAVTPAAIGRS